MSHFDQCGFCMQRGLVSSCMGCPHGGINYSLDSETERLLESIVFPELTVEEQMKLNEINRKALRCNPNPRIKE